MRFLNGTATVISNRPITARRHTAKPGDVLEVKRGKVYIKDEWLCNAESPFANENLSISEEQTKEKV